MKQTRTFILQMVIGVLALGCVQAATAQMGQGQFTREWADDPIWHDGKAEWAVYEAERPIYGKMRKYESRIITNKEHFSTKTFTKDASNGGLPVFKHHIRDDIPVANYVYHYGMMSYVGVADYANYKLDHASIEDCGSTFKRFLNWQGEVDWEQDSYFPNEGSRQGKYDAPKGLGFLDAMTLVLRGYPFEDAKQINLKLLPDQSTTKWSPYVPQDWIAVYMGLEDLNLPIGKTPAHHVQLRFVGPTRQRMAPIDYWFDATGKRQNVLVQYAGPHGVKYRLKSVERFAYWQGN